MEIVIDFTKIIELGSLPWYEMLWQMLFVYWGWVPLLIIIFRGMFWPLWMEHIQGKFYANIKWIYLAVDVPKNDEQSVKAIETFFSHLAGIAASPNKWEKYVKGAFQLSFSLEIVSIDGYVQYLIRTSESFRDLVEAGIYAQYPDAEVTEVEDYTQFVPSTFPNETHDLWGTEFMFLGDNYKPIRTYRDFEHNVPKTKFLDPLASILETMSSIGKGEQIWVQFVITPAPADWKEKGEKAVKEILGMPVVEKKSGIMNAINKAVDVPLKVVDNVLEDVTGSGIFGMSGEEKKEQKEKIMYSPVEVKEVENIRIKISKTAFITKMRFIYVGEKEKFSKGRGVAPMMGGFKQFTDTQSNGVRPVTKITTAAPGYIFIQKRVANRQNKILRGYKSRSFDVGLKTMILNTEELATLWHFPSFLVKTPLLKRTDYKKGTPPSSLPTADTIFTEAEKENKPLFDYDNEYFEQKFAKDKDLYEQFREEREERAKKVITADDRKQKDKNKEQDEVAIKGLSKENTDIKEQEESSTDQEDKTPTPPSNLPIAE